jgi:hypothetical protein
VLGVPNANQFATIVFGNGLTISGGIYYLSSTGQPGDPTSNNSAEVVLSINVTDLNLIQYINNNDSQTLATSKKVSSITLYTTTLNTNANTVFQFINLARGF